MVLYDESSKRYTIEHDPMEDRAGWNSEIIGFFDAISGEIYADIALPEANRTLSMKRLRSLTAYFGHGYETVGGDTVRIKVSA